MGVWGGLGAAWARSPLGAQPAPLHCCSAYRARSSPGMVLPAASCQNGLQVPFSAQNNALAKSTSSELCLSGFVVNCSELKQSLKVGITFLSSFPNSSMTPGKKLEGLVAAAITPMTPDG